MMSALDDQLRDHYRAMHLDSDALADIMDSGGQVAPDWFSFRSTPVRAGLWALAAMLVLTLSVGIHDYGTHKERTSRTLYEAALNHSTRLELEFKSENIQEIDQSMSQLPFEVALPMSFKEQYAVLGSRYCTINGELAAHVKFIDKNTKKQVSLFMARSVEDLRDISATADTVNGVNVKLWTESGLFYAMASRSPLASEPQ